MNYDAIEHWMIALIVAGCSLVLLSFLKYFLTSHANAGKYPLLAVLKRTHSFFLIIVSIYIGSRFLVIPPSVSLIIWRITVAAVAVQAGLWGNEIIYYLLQRSKMFGIVDAEVMGSVSIINFLIKVALWSVIAIFLLGNWGFDITALVAGLGIGGIAVALAVQNILGDLFASLSIVVDKPFTIGDFIQVDEHKGTVEQIGLKTTRIRSQNGELLIFSNADLLKSRVSNYKQMQRRRTTFNIGISNETKAEILRVIPQMVESIIRKQKLATFERCHFKDIGDYGYNFEVVYWIETADKTISMDIQQDINLSILEEFGKKGIQFASPTPYYHTK